MTTATATFTDRLWAAYQPIWEQQIQHPFLHALVDGTLPRENFSFYIRQDARYLDEFAKAFAFAVTKAGSQAEMQYFAERLLHTLAVEQALHYGFAEQFGLSIESVRSTPLAPTNYAYTRHILYTAATDSLAALLAALLPCAWIYAAVGEHFARLLGGPPAADHPYAAWISLYASPEFAEVGDWLRARLNERAATLPDAELARLEGLFLASCRYEWMFWDMASKLEIWPV